MDPLFIPVLLGTGREDRQSARPAAFVVEQMKAAGFQTELIDVRDVATPVTHHSKQADPKIAHWKETMQKADGLVIVTPEYNHGYPGELKIVLDSLLEEYRRKPAVICGVSSGVFGGARAIENLKPVLVYLGMTVLGESLMFGNVKTLFDESGDITDPAYVERAAKLFAELKWYGLALKAAREKG